LPIADAKNSNCKISRLQITKKVRFAVVVGGLKKEETGIPEKYLKIKKSSIKLK